MPLISDKVTSIDIPAERSNTNRKCMRKAPQIEDEGFFKMAVLKECKSEVNVFSDSSRNLLRQRALTPINSKPSITRRYASHVENPHTSASVFDVQTPPNVDGVPL